MHTELGLWIDNPVNSFSTFNRKLKNSADGDELLVLGLKFKRAYLIKFYNHPKESDPEMLHNKVLTYRKTLESNTSRVPDRNLIRLPQIIIKQKEKYFLTH